MADTVNSDVLHDGLKNYQIHLQGVSDATGESAVTKIDISTLTGPNAGETPDHFAIKEVEWDIQGFEYVQLLFDADTDDEIVTMSGQGWTNFLGIPKVDPQSTGYTGDIKLTSSGAIDGASYDIKILAEKRNV